MPGAVGKPGRNPAVIKPIKTANYYVGVQWSRWMRSATAKAGLVHTWQTQSAIHNGLQLPHKLVSDRFSGVLGL